jgi:hypothetical protein
LAGAAAVVAAVVARLSVAELDSVATVVVLAFFAAVVLTLVCAGELSDTGLEETDAVSFVTESSVSLLLSWNASTMKVLLFRICGSTNG